MATHGPYHYLLGRSHQTFMPYLALTLGQKTFYLSSWVGINRPIKHTWQYLARKHFIWLDRAPLGRLRKLVSSPLMNTIHIRNGS